MVHAKSTNPDVFILPDLGEGVHEAELIKWRVKPGDSVAEHDILAEMETDKALVEVPSPRAGVIAQLHGQEGETLHVGNPLVTYQGAGGGASGGSGGSGGSTQAATSKRPTTTSAARKPARSAEPAADSEPTHSANGDGHFDEDVREDAGTVVGNLSANRGVEKREGKALATPAVRRLARDLGVDIDSIDGTGLAGRVTDRDVRAAAQSGGGTGVSPVRSSAPRPSPVTRATPPARHPSGPSERQVADETTQAALSVKVASSGIPAPPLARGDVQRVPFRGTRRTIAKRLRQSVDTAVHFTVMDEAEVTPLDAARAQLQQASGEKISYLPFVISAVCRAMQAFPSLNATVDDENEEVLRHSAVSIGVATDTEHGLSVPVIPDADTLGVLEIGRHVAELARMTRERSIPRERLMGSTFTISNVGSYAGRFATPVINYPEVAILAVGRVHEGVVAQNGAIRIGKLLPLSLACDHRVVDGAEGARCLAHIIALLQKPQDLLAPARA